VKKNTAPTWKKKAASQPVVASRTRPTLIVSTIAAAKAAANIALTVSY